MCDQSVDHFTAHTKADTCVTINRLSAGFIFEINTNSSVIHNKLFDKRFQSYYVGLNKHRSER